MCDIGENIMNKKEEFKKELYNQSKTLPFEFNSNLAIRKAKKILYKFFPNANMELENTVIDYFKHLVDCHTLLFYINECIDDLMNENS